MYIWLQYMYVPDFNQLNKYEYVAKLFWFKHGIRQETLRENQTCIFCKVTLNNV